MTENTIELAKKIKGLEVELKKLKDNQGYGLKWEEKPEEFEERAKNALPILKEQEKMRIDNKHHLDHLIIEGDNYHSLSTLSYTHKGAIDVIYIDPPYNTGNQDFIYNDDYVDKEDSYRHSKWLSFMNKRLNLAKDLLSEEGVIFISIDDNEFAQLKLLCDNIFKEENMLGCFIRNKKLTGGYDNAHINTQHEYILSYAKNKGNFAVNLDEKESKYKLTDEYGKKYKRDSLWNIGGLTYSPSLDYPIMSPDGTEIWPNGNRGEAFWLWGKKKVELERDKLKFEKDKKGKWKVYKRVYASDGIVPGSMLDKEIVKGNTHSSGEIKNLFSGDKIFDYAKPTTLLKYIISKGGTKNSIILDFFAGSGTAGHSVLELNKEDGGNRQFILCSSKESTKKEPNKNICRDITYERIKRVVNGHSNSKLEKIEGLGGGNLRYYTTEFVKITKSTDDLRHRFINLCNDLLCIKENTFEEVKTKQKSEYLKLFKKGEKHTVILYDIHHFDELLNLLESADGKIAVYIFSLSKEIYEEEISYIEKDITIQNIPDDILQTYKKIFNF